jgi:hypothetical protein
MSKIKEPPMELIQFKAPLGLKRKFEARCASLGLDKPAAARLALALFAENGIDYAKKAPAGTGNQGG